MLTLRPYQEETLKELYAYWEKGKGKFPVVVLPTGAGKSLIIAAFVEQVCRESPYVHIMIVVHSRELVQQNHDELLFNYPEANAGIYSAGLNSYDTNKQVIFAGIQSVYNKVFSFPKIDIVIIDEAHSIPQNEDTRYGKFVKDMRTANPNVVMWGTTATPYRTDSGLLTEGENRLFDGIAHCADLKTLIKQGYLVPVISKGGVQKIDLKNVHIRAGDYAQNELAHAADDPELVRLAVNEIVEYGKDRKAWLIYCSGIAHAEHVATEIKKHGIDCKVLTGDTKMEERDKIITDFRNGKLRCICNVGVLVAGFNAPITDLIALLFSTISTGKYVQVVGRGARTYPGKTNCLLLDYGSNVITHGVLDEIDPQKKKDVFGLEKIKPPMKECPKCHVIIHARIMKCPACEFDFPIPPAQAHHGTEAYSGAVLSDQQVPFMVDIKDTWVSKHSKPGKTPSVKIAFYDQMEREYPVWACLDHKGFAAEKGQALIKQLGGKATTVDEALKEHDKWKQVERLQVKMDGKFPRILGFVFKKGQTTQTQLGDNQ